MFSISQLADITGKTRGTIRDHHRQGWLKARTYPGVLGLRITATEAKKWLKKHFPTISLSPAVLTPTILPPVVVAPVVVEAPGEWMQSALLDSAHFVTAGKNACHNSPTGAKLPQWAQWHPSPFLRRCRQCMHAVSKSLVK
jgi:hypothetical protein